MARIYLAARYGRKDQLIPIRLLLQQFGHTVTSRWLDTEWERKTDGVTLQMTPEERAQHGLIDLHDVASSDIIISFTETPESGAGAKGGRHVEFGYALALHKRMIVIGPRENIFHELPVVERFDTVEAMMAAVCQKPASYQTKEEPSVLTSDLLKAQRPKDDPTSVSRRGA